MKHSSSRSSVDLLGAPVPSAIPSPDLHPIAKQLDLMKFENIAGIWAQINVHEHYFNSYIIKSFINFIIIR